MDEVVKKAMGAAQSKKRTSVPWNFDEPWKQPYYTYSNKWQPVDPSHTDIKQPSASWLALYAWNIDFMLPFAESRMQLAIRHLEKLVNRLDERTARVIYLQECVESDLKLLAKDPWVQRCFALTDIDIDNWQSGYYGTVTLVDRRLPISSCFRVHYSQTRMERDGLFVDILINNRTIEMVARYMRDATLHGAAVAGDFNAIQDFDRHLHSDNGLKDAYLELGGSEEDAEGGHTWGQQAATFQREKFGTSRMDKVFFCGGIRCFQFERFGAGVELENDDERKKIVNLGFDRPWITDHFGVMAVFEVQESSSL
ncbi:hypothetical protein LTR37_009495 [Vermiconidia calcicola]|uniref:Uncharacterized protein n=1 Tax=Vermiconidia calcicola TaxID=1690605 RepID=A0ACC3N921_9PEZI|nr:hypothetical protein LTR37_009495 [Vermiconidia calcicola]